MSGCDRSARHTAAGPGPDAARWKYLAAKLVAAARAELRGRLVEMRGRWRRAVYARAFSLASELLGTRLQGGCCDENEAALYGASQYLLERAKWFTTRAPQGPGGTER